MEIPTDRRPHLLVPAVLFEGGVGVVACLIGALLGRPIWRSIHWRLDDAMAGGLATLPLLLLLVWLMQSRWPPLARLAETVRHLVKEVFAGASWLELGTLSFLAGVGEELLFRGLIQDLIGSLWSPWAGLLLASLLFGLAHPISVTYALFATAMGLYLGWLHLSSGNLLVPIITHALYDFVALVWLVHKARG